MGRATALIFAALGAFGCDGAQTADAGLPDGPAPDADIAVLADGSPDAGPRPDMAGPDMAGPDAGPPDMAPIDGTPPDAGPPPRACASGYGAPEISGNLSGDALAEVSGIAFSATRPGVMWMHTDSGGRARLYAVDIQGNRRGELDLPLENIDWEDIAAAACPDRSGPCLWIADTGDNRRSRDDAAVYAVPEPVVIGGDAGRVWRFPVSYPGGPADVEALAVAPAGDAFWLFEKLDGPIARVFGHIGPLVDGEPTLLREVTRINTPGIAIENGKSITGADLHPDGTRLVLRVYTGSYEYVFPADADAARGIADLPFIQPRTVALGPLAEQQGEAITYDPGGRDIWTVSEDPALQGGQPLHRYPCRD